jgi:hypothetical protein
VLLGANVSFLTIQSVDEAPGDQPTRTPAQRASYFSILASLGTIVASLVLLILVRHREVMGVGTPSWLRSLLALLTNLRVEQIDWSAQPKSMGP